MGRIFIKIKELWWLVLIVAVAAILMLVPTKSGFPGKDYMGCQDTDPKYKSYCLVTKINNLSTDTEGKTVVTVPVSDSKETRDYTFELNSDHGLKLGDKVFLNISPWNNTDYVFINHDSNLLITIIDMAFEASQGPTAEIDFKTMKENK